MDEALKKSGEWPNVAINPETGLHAVTGEPVVQPSYTKLGLWLDDIQRVTLRDGEIVIERKVVEP